jgi:hypothetical protein
MPSTLAFGSTDSTFLLAHARQTATTEDWDAFTSALDASLGQVKRLLVFTAGASIDARQREQVEGILKRGKLRVSVLTTSRLVRGAVTALSWFNIPIKAFVPSDVNRALDHIRVPDNERPSVLTKLDEIKARVI